MIQSREPIENFLNRISERWWEHRLGINTRGMIPDEKLKGPRNDGVGYAPVPFRAFFRAMEHVPHELLTGTFLDYGAGKGRALVLAARGYRFHRVVGVEINPDLCRQAEHNLEQLAVPQAEIICCDAAIYEPPSDTRVFFFFNPFFGEAMKMVVQKIHYSLLENPRRAAIVIYRPSNFMAATAGEDWFVEHASGKIMSAYWRVFVTRVGYVPAIDSAMA
jgi:predicted RNA methylase